MEEIKSLLLSVKKKAEAAALKIEVLENEKAELKARLEKLKAENEAKTQEVINLQQAKDVLKIAKVVSSDDNNKGSKQKIAELVREIDNCIMLLK